MFEELYNSNSQILRIRNDNIKNYSYSFLLVKLLLQRYKKDIVIFPETVLCGKTQGTMFGTNFLIISCRDNFLQIITTKKGNEILNVLKPVCSEFMNCQTPILSYDLFLNNQTILEPLTIMEWDLNDPNSRIRNILYLRLLSEQLKIENINSNLQ